MDDAGFDRLAAAVGRYTSRRQGFRAAVAVGLTTLLWRIAPGAATLSEERRTIAPHPEGPCRAGSMNSCSRDGDCCTSNCVKGRCRWVRVGAPCTTNRQCKSQHCLDGICAGCRRDRDCDSSAPVCELGQCVECRGASVCEPEDEGCIAAVCSCGADLGCRGDAPICCAVLGAVKPVAATGYRLQMSELIWAPNSEAAAHTHPLAQVACVQSGALGFTLQQGSATITRGSTDSRPASTEVVPLNTEVFIYPRDCISYDEYADPTIHTVWNASSGETVLWMSDLVKIGEDYTEMV